MIEANSGSGPIWRKLYEFPGEYNRNTLSLGWLNKWFTNELPNSRAKLDTYIHNVEKGSQLAVEAGCDDSCRGSQLALISQTVFCHNSIGEKVRAKWLKYATKNPAN